MTIKVCDWQDLAGKRLLIRQDLNVPLYEDGQISDDHRILQALPTLEAALQAGCRVIVVSHMGRPVEGVFDSKYSLSPVAEHLSKLLEQPVPLVKDWLNGVDVAPGQIVLAENVRFCVGEKNNDLALGEAMANCCDVYINDAFASCHRAHASTHAVVKFAKQAKVGPLLQRELEAMEQVLQSPARPLLAICGGAKVSTKLGLLDSLLEKIDILIPGGGIANTFLKARGVDIGGSLYEPDLVPAAKKIMEKADKLGVRIELPLDVVVAKSLSNDAVTRTVTLDSQETLDIDDKILDVGEKTRKLHQLLTQDSKTVLFNGPVGVFECEPFAAGSHALCSDLASASAFVMAGGGDTVAALRQFGFAEKMNYVSTGGGAFLELIEKGSLPALDILEEESLKEEQA